MTDFISINPKYRNDAFQRYKIPKLDCFVTLRGNGTFTTINNLKDVAKNLFHPHDILFKAIGYYLATNINMKNNTIKGAHEHNQIQDAIDKYITTFVLCPKCTIPELSYSVTGKKKKMKCEYKCSACGENGDIEIVSKEDNKILQLIIKHISSGNKWPKHSTALLDEEIHDLIFPFDL